MSVRKEYSYHSQLPTHSFTWVTRDILAPAVHCAEIAGWCSYLCKLLLVPLGYANPELLTQHEREMT